MVFPIHLNLLLTTSANILNPVLAMVLLIVLYNSVTLSDHLSPHRGKWLLLLFRLTFWYQIKDFSQRKLLVKWQAKRHTHVQNILSSLWLVRICCPAIVPLPATGFWLLGELPNDMHTEMTKSHSALYFCTRCVLQSTQLWGEIRKWNSVKQNNQGERKPFPSDQQHGHGRKIKCQFQPEIVFGGVPQIFLTSGFLQFCAVLEPLVTAAHS